MRMATPTGSPESSESWWNTFTLSELIPDWIRIVPFPRKASGSQSSTGQLGTHVFLWLLFDGNDIHVVCSSITKQRISMSACWLQIIEAEPQL